MRVLKLCQAAPPAKLSLSFSRERQLLTASPGVKFFRPFQCFLGCVIALPVPRDVLVGFGQRRVDVDGAEDLVQADAMLHRQHVFGDQVAGMLADDCLLYTSDAADE